MRTLYYPDNSLSSGRFAATIGFFDGVHAGHCFVLQHLKRMAHDDLQTMVVTFERHPRQVLQPDWHPALLTSLEEKRQLLEKEGIDVMVVLRFGKEMADLSAREFIALLHRDLHVETLLTGFDNRFGRRAEVQLPDGSCRSEGFKDYVEYGRELGVQVVHGFALDLKDGRKVSSSLIRQLLSEGDVALAARALGRRYMLTGRVVHGEQMGRQLGFPTANMELSDADRLVPASGVYAVLVGIEGHEGRYQGMMNIGTRPTFGSHYSTLEVNIFDFMGDIYGKTLTVVFVERLRSEQRFESPQALMAQMRQDAEQSRKLLSLNPQPSTLNS